MQNLQKLKPVVWHDPRIAENENAFLAETIVGEVLKFKTVEETLAHLESRTSTCILISSGTNGETLFDQIYTAPTTKYRRKITKAAIFCMDVKKHGKWVKDKEYKMIISVESDPVKVLEILQKLWDDYNNESNHDPKNEVKNDYIENGKYNYEKKAYKDDKSSGYGGYDDKPKAPTEKNNDYGYKDKKVEAPKPNGNGGYQDKGNQKKENDPNKPFPYYNEKKGGDNSDEEEDNPYQNHKVDYS